MSILWRIELLGTLRLTRGEQIVTQFDTRKTAALLARLAYHPARLHSREVLAETLWPDEDPEATRGRLRQALAVLRRALEDSEPCPISVIRGGRTEIGIVPGAIRTDVGEFEEQIKRAQVAATAREQADGYARAVEIYGGELLPGYFEEWIAPERERLAELHRMALVNAAKLAAELGEIDSAISFARRAVRTAPTEEEAHHALIQVFLRSGRVSDAVRQYRELERILRETFASTPSQETQKLLSQWQDKVQLITDPNAIRSRAPVSEQIVERAEPEGGAVPLESAYYICRPTDAAFENAVARRDSIVLVKGTRESGKTSLLARGMQKARETGARVVLTDLQSLTAEQIESADSLFLTLAQGISEQLDIEIDFEDAWNPKRGWNVNFEKFLRRDVLGRLDTPLVWAIDEVDRLFGHQYSTEVFGLFRSWHNQRALNPFGPWAKFTLAIAYATEAHLFIQDLNQSPFNVGTRLTLEDFTFDQIEELNRRYGSPLASESEIACFYALIAGHPALARRGLQALSERQFDILALEVQADRDDGLFGNHLRSMLHALQQDPLLCADLLELLRGNQLSSEISYFRLHSAGIVAGSSSRDVRLRCRLYQRYLERRLL